jgi:hypothetical protein
MSKSFDDRQRALFYMREPTRRVIPTKAVLKIKVKA